jgi:hypothetical protein
VTGAGELHPEASLRTARRLGQVGGERARSRRSGMAPSTARSPPDPPPQEEGKEEGAKCDAPRREAAQSAPLRVARDKPSS